MKFSIEDVQFTRYSAIKWSEFSSFQLLERTIQSLKVVNNAGERSIRLLEECKNILSKVIMQYVENSRKKMPDFKKTSLAFSSSANM